MANFNPNRSILHRYQVGIPASRHQQNQVFDFKIKTIKRDRL
jgi:hypothetical protein